MSLSVRERTAVGAALALGAAHALPAVTGLTPLRRALLPGLSGIGRPGGIALTFDDGPDPLGTPAVLAQLAALGWRATFFLLGVQVRRYPDQARRLVAEGHEIALHGDEHRNHLTRTSGALVRDLRTSAALVQEVTGATLRWYRPPYGVLSSGTLAATRATGLTPVLWTAWGKDWARTTPARITRTVLRDLRDGGTVLLHDSDCTSSAGSWRATAQSLPLLAAGVRERGWQVRTLGEHLGGPA